VGGLHHAPGKSASCPTCTWTRGTARSFSPLPAGGAAVAQDLRRIPPTPSSPSFKAPRERGRARTRADRDRDPQPPAGRDFDSVFADAVQRAYRPSWNPCRATLASASPCTVGAPSGMAGSARSPASRRAGALVSPGRWSFSPVLSYEPILAVIPPWDQQGQLERMARISDRASA